MIAYRPHRGSLDESLKEMQTFNTKEEMFAYIEETSGDILDFFKSAKTHRGEEDIRLSEIRLQIDKDIVFDNRINWNTQYVLGYGYIIGMCDLNFEE